MTYERVVIALCLYLLEQCLNPVFLTSIKTCNFVTFYEFLIRVGVHHTTTAGSSLGSKDNICEDTLSSQSTYKINSGCPCYKASIAPNPKLLNDFEPSKEQLETVYGGTMEEVNELRLQIASKKTLSAIEHQGNTLNTNIAEVQAQNVVFWLLDDI
jgi:hypothetical protein